MNRNSQKLRDLLLNLINKQKQDLTGLVSDPDVNFSRNRKIPYENMILSLLTMEGATLTNELLRQFGCSTTTATSSAFVQQRKKILPAALENLFQEFTSQTARSDNYRGYKLLAIDGSDIQIATNPKDKKSFFQTKEGVKPYNLLHLNVLYNLLSHTYEDAIVYKAKEAGDKIKAEYGEDTTYLSFLASGGQFFIFDGAGFGDVLYNDMGLAKPAGMPEQTDISLPVVTYEGLAAIQSDYIFVIATDEDLAQLEANSIWNNLPAVKNGNVVVLESSPYFNQGYSSIGREILVDEIGDMLNETK